MENFKIYSDKEYAAALINAGFTAENAWKNIKTRKANGNLYGINDYVESYLKQKKTVDVICLNDGTTYTFVARTGYEAMQMMKYTLDLARKDKGAVINKTKTGLHLWMDHSGKTYSVRI